MDNFLKKGKCSSHTLTFRKSQLALYNEGKCIFNKDDGSKTGIDVMLSQLDTELPADLETWASSEQSIVESASSDESELEDLETSLRSMSEAQEPSSEFGVREEKTEKGLNQICGLIEVKSKLKNIFIYPILYPQFFPEYTAWSQVLLYGPPGTGKSLLAKAVAEEIDAELYRISSADLLSHWQGETEKRIRSMFEKARCSESPVILFFDEIDGLCRKRSSSEDDPVRRIKTELLIQLQEGGGDRNKQTYLIGATNCPWDIDSAFLRRFHVRIYIPLPDKHSRIDILRSGFRQVTTALTREEWESVGDLTKGYSGSDLNNIVMASCCERLNSAINCRHWTWDGEFWVPAAPGSPRTKLVNFEDIPRHQIRCRPIGAADIWAAVQKTPKTVTTEEVSKYDLFAAQL